MEALISSTSGILTVFMIAIASSFLLQKTRLKSLGPAIICILIGIGLSNFGILPFKSEFYKVISKYLVPPAIALMLFQVNLKDLMKLSKQPMLAMGIACFSAAVVTIASGLVFAPNIVEGWKLGGMFVGTYTGGSSNLTAIGVGLNASPETFALANAADYVIGLPLLLMLFAVTPLLSVSEKFSKLWPYSLTEKELSGDDSGEELFAKKEWAISEVAIALALAFVVAFVSKGVAGYFGGSLSDAIKILVLTTLSLGLAQIKGVREIKASMDLGFFIFMFFFVRIGIMIDFASFTASGAVNLMLFCAFVLIGSMLLHLVLCRVFKIKYQYVFVSMIAAIGASSTASALAANNKWKALVPVGVILGVVGYAIGNYLGIGVAYALKFLIGA
ncbi:DUF819 family protein [Acidaminobacter sp. JC074]|uniref:DUF819 family protein n=1 Tax=Acidaminobacter sp. JC074 TaxID=2530199 RepID=UPI001F0F8CA6|nr:DUF819 family protein [Acidaminobacter sp. JC074]MCH4888906.1 DUF819 family protein [Acidaminobacter sp. JC074]